MNKKRFIGKLLEFDRGDFNEERNIKGFLLDYSDDWVLIQNVDDDIFLSGYTILKNSTIKRYRIYDDKNNLVKRALKNLGYLPKTPGCISLDNLEDLVIDANMISPLLVFYREEKKIDACYIGCISQFTEKTMTLETIGTWAKNSGKYRMNKKEITKIEFQTHYEVGLWAAANKSTKKIFLSKRIFKK